MRIITLLTVAALVAGCSGGGSPQRPVLPDFPEPGAGVSDQQRSLVFAYPALGQTDVVPTAPIVLRFSHPVATLPAGTTLKSLFTVKAKTATTGVDFDIKLVDGGKGVVIQPTLPLNDKTEYQIIAPQIPLALESPGAIGNISLQPPGSPVLSFTTRAAFEGPNDLQALTPVFQVAQITPVPTGFLIGSQPFGLIDFSTIRLLMTQPIDSRTVRYGAAAGDTIRLMQGDTLVPARIIAQGNHLSIDPEQDLDPTKSYTLALGTGLRSMLGRALVPGAYGAFVFTPQDSGITTGKASRIAVEVPDAGTSSLLGSNVNQVPVASPLLGQGERAPKPQAKGSLFADLALPANFAQFNPAVTPLRVPRGNILKAGNLSVKLDGKVPAGLDTGDLTITLISDANGLLLPNRYSNSLVAPALVMLELDINVSAANGTSNGAFTQDITHVQVAGIATVDQANQILNIEAVGTIELKVLGVDNAVGVLALKMRTDLKQAPGTAPVDTILPTVQSWVPGVMVNGLAGGEFIRPGDPMIVNFAEAMDIKSFQPGAITLLKGNTPEPFTSRLDGVSLIVSPVTPWQHGANYRLSLAPSLTDMAGNALGLLQNFDFTIPALANTKTRPPVVLSNYPGYPCPIEAGTRNVANSIQGRCAGGQAGDDLLPLPLIEPNRAIEAAFSQSLNAASVRLATACNGVGSMRVERIDASGNCLSVVPGQLQARPRDLRFVPDQPWVAGQLYRYVLHSNNSLTSSSADCTGTQAICGINGLPLQTQLIARTLADATNPQRGGPAMEIFFRGGADLGGSNIGLRVLPVLDVNTNFRLDPTERRASVADLVNGMPVARLGATPATNPVCGAGTNSSTDPESLGLTCLASNGALLQPDRISIGRSFTGAATSFNLGCRTGVGAEDEPGGAQGKECQGQQFLLISAALGARIGSSINEGGVDKVQVFINPAMVVTSGANIFATLGLTKDASPGSQALFAALGQIPVLGPLINTAVDTGAGFIGPLLPIAVRDSTNTELPENQIYSGPLVFRMRHPAGNGPIKGFIFRSGDKLVLETQLDLYTDIPEINATATVLGLPLIPIEHSVRSNDDLTATANPLNGSGSVKVRGEVKFLDDGRLTVQLSNIETVRLTASLSGLGGLLAGDLKVRVPAGRFVIDASLAPLKR
ncbi:MAG: Ig-like domain-containing protein [Pseudomonadota bacterium]